MMQGRILRVIIPLFAASFLAYGYNNIFMVLTPLFTQEIGGSVAEAGLQGAVFLIVAVVLRFYLGPLADRRGQKLVMAIGIAAFVVGALLFQFCTEFWQVLGIRSVQAVGISAFFPCATALVANTVPPERMGFFLGIYRFIISLSLLFGPWGASVLVDIGGYPFCFLIMTVFSVIALVLVLFLPAHKNKVQKDERERGGLHTIFNTFRTAIRENPRVIAVVMGTTLCAALGYGLLFSFASLFITDVRPAINSGLYFTPIGIGGLVANLIVGWVSDRVDRNILMVLCLVFTGVGVSTLGFLGTSEMMFFVSGLMAGFGYAGTITTVLAIVSAKVSEAHRTSTLSLQQNGVDLGIACASGGFGFVFAFAPDASTVYIVQGAIMIVVALVVFLVSRKDPSREEAMGLE